MEQVRLKAAAIQRIDAPKLGSVARVKRVDLPPLDLIPPQPPLLLPKPMPARKERILAMLDQARKRTAVAKWIPKPFRVFFRNQEDYNRTLLESVASLAKANAELANRVEQLTRCLEVEQEWLGQMHERASGHLTWIETAGRLIGSTSSEFQVFRDEARAASAKLGQRQESSELEATSSSSALRKSVDALRGEQETMAARLSHLQGQADDHHNLRADLARVGEHIRNLQTVHDRHVGEVDRVAAGALELRRTITALDERQVSEGSYLRMELSQQASLLREWFGRRGSKNNRKVPAPLKETAAQIPGRLDAFYVSFEDRFRGSEERFADLALLSLIQYCYRSPSQRLPLPIGFRPLAIVNDLADAPAKIHQRSACRCECEKPLPIVLPAPKASTLSASGLLRRDCQPCSAFARASGSPHFISAGTHWAQAVPGSLNTRQMADHSCSPASQLLIIGQLTLVLLTSGWHFPASARVISGGPRAALRSAAFIAKSAARKKGWRQGSNRRGKSTVCARQQLKAQSSIQTLTKELCVSSSCGTISATVHAFSSRVLQQYK